MINELYKLGDTIAVAGISQKEWHRQLKELRKISDKTPCFRVSISGKSVVSGIDEITIDQKNYFVSKLRKWEPSNGYSFPVFNMPNLFSFSKEEAQEKDEWLSGKKPFDIVLLKSWCTEKVNNWDKKAWEKLEKCLHTVPKELEQKINDNNNLVNNSILELVRLLDKISVEHFRESLERYVFKKLEEQENVKTLLRFLFSGKPEGKELKKNNQSNDIQVALDLYDWKTFGKPVINEKSIEWLNSVLLKSEQKEIKHSEALTLRDAFNGEYTEFSEKMPSVKLAGGVGDVKLRSMYNVHECQYRYKLIEDGSYPINRINRGKIKSALEWLKEPDREGKTWGKVDNDEIIFAYPSIIPPKPPKMVAMMGGSNAETPIEFETTAKFKSIAEDVIKTLKGLSPGKEIKNVQIFSIRKMDKARSKVVYCRNYTTERIIISSKKWQEGSANIPSITFRIWPQKTTGEVNTKPENIEPQTPMPLQIAKIINKSWKLDGTIAGELKRVKYYQGLELLLEKNKRELAKHLLSVLVTNIYGLVFFLGNLLHSGNAIKERFQQENYIFFPSLMGIILYSQNRLKEMYMEDIPYLLGQILKISDELHAFYCKIVRAGSIPPQLIGNSLMVSAFETPERALAQLGQRIIPYIAWAKQYRTKNHETKGEESWRAAWYLNLYERNINLVKERWEALHNARFGDKEKAELFIGYLADFPKKDEATDQKSDNKTGGKQ